MGNAVYLKDTVLGIGEDAHATKLVTISWSIIFILAVACPFLKFHIVEIQDVEPIE